MPSTTWCAGVRPPRARGSATSRSWTATTALVRWWGRGWGPGTGGTGGQSVAGVPGLGRHVQHHWQLARVDAWHPWPRQCQRCTPTSPPRCPGLPWASAGWDLACKLVCERNSLNRGRLSAVEALRHRYFRPEF